MPGDLVEQGPNDVRVYVFDWDARNLPAAVTIDSSVFTVTAVHPASAAALTVDNELILSGDRKTWLRLSGGALGATYDIANRIVTNETPAQTKELSFRLLIQYHA